MRRFGNRALFPLYARLREDNPDRLRHRTFWIRAALMAAVLPPVCLLAIFGDYVVKFLYDTRYHEAGWMLQYLALAAIGTTVSLTINPVLLAVGDSFRHMLSMSLQAAMTLAAMIIGGIYGGAKGVIIGIVVSKYLDYAVIALFVRRYGVWLPMLDVAALGGTTAIVLLAWCVMA
jgi:O-antigen/teichoic acid export membrane protein